MSSSEKDTLSGAGIGAATGAVVGELATGQPLHGLAIGAAAGAIGGWLYDRHKKEEEQKEEAEDYWGWSGLYLADIWWMSQRAVMATQPSLLAVRRWSPRSEIEHADRRELGIEYDHRFVLMVVLMFVLMSSSPVCLLAWLVAANRDASAINE
jgi:hypothetical protein